MARSRRWPFALLPVLVIGACLLPPQDEFAAARRGQPLSIEKIAERDGEVFASHPEVYHQERAYGFDGDAAAMERDVRARLTVAKEWDSTMKLDFTPAPDLAKLMPPRQAWGYIHQASGDEVDLLRYEKPVEGLRLIVILREKDDAWGRLRRKILRLVGR